MASAILVSRYARSEVDCFAIGRSIYADGVRKARVRPRAFLCLEVSPYELLLISQ